MFASPAQATPSILLASRHASVDDGRAQHGPAIPQPLPASHLLGRDASQACLTTIVVPVHANTVDPELTKLALNIGIKAKSRHLVEQVVEVDLRKLTLLEVRTRRNAEVLSCNDLFHLSDVVPLIGSGDEVADIAQVARAIVATDECTCGGEPVVVVKVARTSTE